MVVVGGCAGGLGGGGWTRVGAVCCAARRSAQRLRRRSLMHSQATPLTPASRTHRNPRLTCYSDRHRGAAGKTPASNAAGFFLLGSKLICGPSSLCVCPARVCDCSFVKLYAEDGRLQIKQDQRCALLLLFSTLRTNTKTTRRRDRPSVARSIDRSRSSSSFPSQSFVVHTLEHKIYVDRQSKNNSYPQDQHTHCRRTQSPPHAKKKRRTVKCARHRLTVKA